MKKFYFILCVALSVSACGKIDIEGDVPGTGVAARDIVFDFTVRYPGETRGVKEAWQSGDKVFVFFEDVTTGYVTMSYGASGWNEPVLNGTADMTALTASGKVLTAVFLPFGGGATASYDEGWKFSETYYTYYMRTEKVAYTVNTTGGITTLTAVMEMENPDDYVQFFVEDATATDEGCSLGCDAVIPVGVASVAADGTISETNDKTYVDDMPGYVYDNGTDPKGYLFSGKLDGGYEYSGNYYFAKTKSDGSRHDYFVTGKTLASHSAVKLPAASDVYSVTFSSGNTINDFSGKWVKVGSGETVTLAKRGESGDITNYGTWHTCNYDCTKPEERGTKYARLSYYGHQIVVPSGVTLPSKEEFQALVDNCVWTWLPIHGKLGMVVKADNSFLFLCSEGSLSGVYWSSTGTPVGTGYYLYFSYKGYIWVGAQGLDALSYVRPIQR